MDALQSVVEHLNEAPFLLNIRLVELDEHSPQQLRHLLLLVLHHIEPAGAWLDAEKAASGSSVSSASAMMQQDQQQQQQQQDEQQGDAASDVLAARIVAFLRLLKFPAEDAVQQEALAKGVADGAKSVMFTVLQWLLVRRDSLAKRAYLARFLLPLEVPPDVLGSDERVAELLGQLRALQDQFKVTHKAVDQLRAAPVKADELRAEAAQLADERRQLLERIERNRKVAETEPGFQEMLLATHELRLQQEEEAKLADRMRDLRFGLQLASSRREEAQQRLTVVRQQAEQRQRLTSSASGSASAVELGRTLVAAARQQTEAALQRVQSLRAEAADIQRQLRAAELESAGPEPSRDSVETVLGDEDALKQDMAALQTRVTRRLRELGDEKLEVFWQHVIAMSRKIVEKDGEAKTCEAEALKLQSEVAERRAEIAALESTGASAASGSGSAAAEAGGFGGDAGGARMSQQELRDFVNQLRQKAATAKKLRADADDLRAELLVARRTEQLLKDRDRSLGDVLTALEEQRGVVGFRASQERLERASEVMAMTDREKDAMLQEISATVSSIQAQVAAHKDRLQPLVADLRELRSRFKDTEERHSRQRDEYDRLAAALQAERAPLEAECSQLEEETLALESRLFLMRAELVVSETRLEKVRREDGWRRTAPASGGGSSSGGAGHLASIGQQPGVSRLTPEFATLGDLYANKLSQQTSLITMLRRRQREIQETEVGAVEQRRMFLDLQRLLQIRLACRRRETAAFAAAAAAEAVAAASAQASGADVLTIV